MADEEAVETETVSSETREVDGGAVNELAILFLFNGGSVVEKFICNVRVLLAVDGLIEVVNVENVGTEEAAIATPRGVKGGEGRVDERCLGVVGAS